jgi:hypothetical protein
MENESNSPGPEPPLPYRLGEPDVECHYPVSVDDGKHIGRIFRWHGAWLAVPAGSEDEIRVADGRKGRDRAAQYLAAEYAAGRITPLHSAASSAQVPTLSGPVPLLHWRLPATTRNVEAARTAMAGLAAYRWWPLSGYPGSDNPWFMSCQLCEWTGPRYWSHLRGRNKQPPPLSRHRGCVAPETVRALIPAYREK